MTRVRAKPLMTVFWRRPATLFGMGGAAPGGALLPMTGLIGHSSLLQDGLHSEQDGNSISGHIMGTDASAVSNALSHLRLTGGEDGTAGVAGGRPVCPGVGRCSCILWGDSPQCAGQQCECSSEQVPHQPAAARTRQRRGARFAAHLPRHTASHSVDTLVSVAAGLQGLLGELRAGHVAVREEMAQLKAAVRAAAVQQEEIVCLLGQRPPAEQ